MKMFVEAPEKKWIGLSGAKDRSTTKEGERKKRERCS